MKLIPLDPFDKQQSTNQACNVIHPQRMKIEDGPMGFSSEHKWKAKFVTWTCKT